jgi:hypothetical protein
VVLFKRLPKLRWKPPEREEIVPIETQAQRPDLADDFAALETELMPYFRQLDANALRLQNQFRLHQVTLILGGTLATILGALHANLNSGTVAWIGIIQTMLAVVLSGVALRSRTARAQERYSTERLKAERLRSEYFLFLGQVGTYSDERQRLPQLIRRVSDVKIGESK